jgi:hypothetical protein
MTATIICVEKCEAFDRLAALVERIVNPPSGNVPLRKHGKRGWP